jgi:hypothetical protein
MSLLLVYQPSGSGASISGAGQIVSAEALGAPLFSPAVYAAAIASGEAVGQPSIGAAAASISGGSIASLEAFGASIIAASIAAIGVASAEAIGQPSVGAAVASITGGSIASLEAFGASIIAASISAVAIASAEALGQPSIGAAVASIDGGSIANLEAFGSPVIGLGIGSTAITSGEALGQPVVAPAVAPQIVTGAGQIATGEAFGLLTATLGGIVIPATGGGTLWRWPLHQAYIDQPEPIELRPQGIAATAVVGRAIVSVTLQSTPAANGDSVVGRPSLAVSLGLRSIDDQTTPGRNIARRRREENHLLRIAA